MHTAPSTDLISMLSAAGNLFSFSAGGVYREGSPGDPPILGSDLTAFTDCNDIQRSVYRQIALQTNLHKPILGYFDDETEASFQWYSLELTLQSGLDELACIKDLEELTVGLMNHRIGIPELKWMKAHWLKFRSAWILRQRSGPLPCSRYLG
ncbi:MAG: hypothetical protein BYD32DRAFT_483237 [Podila humilis]|nr:MAG: hypothetical protein BYD32DRAFT_483237 [Podila humilis]